MGRDARADHLRAVEPRAAGLRPSAPPAYRSGTAEELVPAEQLRSEPLALAEVSERDLVAHVTRLTHRQYSVDLGAYPLGSCTMKYNPKLCDEAAALPGLTGAHPATPASVAQGWLELLVVPGRHASAASPGCTPPRCSPRRARPAS